MYLLFHNDFDGLASATLLREKLRTWDITTTRCVSVDYGNNWTSGWPDEAPGAVAVVDYEYHANALLYFDHHATSFRTESHREHYELRCAAGDTVLLDPTAPSCTSVIAQWAGWTQRYPNVVALANQIDQADFTSVEDYLFGRSTALDLLHTFHRTTEFERLSIMTALEQDNPDEASWVVRSTAQELLRYREVQVRLSESHCWMNGSVALFDARDVSNLRFVPLHYYPEAAVVCAVATSANHFLINVYANPWSTASHLHIGTLLSTYGGGGHANAGVVQPFKTYHDAWSVAYEVAAQINASVSYGNIAEFAFTS